MTLSGDSLWSGSPTAEKMTMGTGSGVGAGVEVGGGVGVAVGGRTLICTVELVDSFSPLKAVSTNTVGFSTATVMLPCRLRFETVPKSGPLISTLVVAPLIDQARMTSAACGLPATTSSGVMVKESMRGASGSGVALGAGSTVTICWSVLGSPPLEAVST